MGSSNGSVTLRRIQAGEGDVSADTRFGEIVLEDVTAVSVTVQSSNGPITIGSVTALEAVLVGNQFGDIDLSDVHAATLEIRNDNGRIVGEGGEIGELVSATNRFGDVEVIGVQAPAYELWASNGDLTVEGAAGSLNLETAFGDIRSEIPLSVTGALVFLVFFAYLRYMRYKETLTLAEKGLVHPGYGANGKGTLRWGIGFAALGIALCMGLYPVGWAIRSDFPLHFGPWMLVGLIPAFFGVSLIAIYYLTSEQAANGGEDQNTDELPALEDEE